MRYAINRPRLITIHQLKIRTTVTTQLSATMKGHHELVKCVRCNEVSLYQGSFPYILLLLGQRISFVILRALFYRGLLNRGSTAVANAVNSNDGFREKACKPHPTRSDRKSFNSHAKHIDPAIFIKNRCSDCM